MTRCDVSERELVAWYDGMPGTLGHVAAHVERCERCGAKVRAWRQAGEQLVAAVDGALGEVEPLLAVRAIQARLAAAEETPWARLRTTFEDLWTFNRRAVQGVVLSAALGALTAPALVYWMGQEQSASEAAHVASVVIESLEYGGEQKPVVYRPDAGTTIIWVEPPAETRER